MRYSLNKHHKHVSVISTKDCKQQNICKFFFCGSGKSFFFLNNFPFDFDGNFNYSIPGVHNIAYAFPKVKIVTTAVDPNVNEKFYIVPGIGNFGDRYFGTEPVSDDIWPDFKVTNCFDCPAIDSLSLGGVVVWFRSK